MAVPELLCLVLLPALPGFRLAGPRECERENTACPASSVAPVAGRWYSVHTGWPKQRRTVLRSRSDSRAISASARGILGVGASWDEMT
jgi:hypothetical protein